MYMPNHILTMIEEGYAREHRKCNELKRKRIGMYPSEEEMSGGE